MRKNIFFLLSILVSFSFTVEAQNVTKILAIGNSFSGDALEEHFYEIAKAGGDSLVIGNIYIGGASLQLHVNNATSNTAAYEFRKIVGGIKTTTKNRTLLSMLQEEDWDYISFQQASPSSGQYNTYKPYLGQLIKYVKENIQGSPKLMLHQTWAYAKNSTHSGFANYGKDQLAMYQAIISAANSAITDHPEIDFVIPSGTAIQNGRSSILGDVFCRDGYHLAMPLGRYTASCTWYEKIMNKSVLGNSYTPVGLNPTQKEIAQNAAHFAIDTPNKVTDMSGFVNFDDDNLIAEAYPATDDTFLYWSSSKTESYGGEEQLIVRFSQDGQSRRDIYLKFDLEASQTKLPYEQVLLRLFGNDMGIADIPLRILKISSNDVNFNWSEQSLIFSNRPTTNYQTDAISEIITSGDAEYKYFYWDITNWVNELANSGQKNISMHLRQISKVGTGGAAVEPMYFYSKENASGKEPLIIINPNTPASIEEETSFPMVDISDGILNVNLVNKDSDLLTIYTMSGAKVLEKRLNNDIKIDVSDIFGPHIIKLADFTQIILF